MGDGQDAEVVLVGGLLDPARYGGQRVHVQAGVDLVQDRVLRPECPHHEGLVPLLLATGEVNVDRPRQEPLVEADALGLGCQQLVDAVGDASGGTGRLGHHRLEAHAGDLGRVLEGQKQAGPGPLPCGQRQQVDAVEGDRTAGHLVAWATHQHV